ncbi:MAG TPA: lysylphosphatidylglycerol synthase transmembrane domain-containing protein [Polyangia bacterium]|jgi:hypothetical protein
MKLVLKLALTLAFTAVCVWLAFPRREDYAKLAAGLQLLEWKYVWLWLPTAAAMQVFRAWRWDYLLRPLGAHIPFWRLLNVSSVGFMAILALPVRLGEFVRPYLVAEKGKLSMSAALGSVAVERTVDGLLVSLYLFVSFLFLKGPHAGQARAVAWGSFGLFALATAYIAVGVRWPEGTLRWTMRLTLLDRLAPRLAERLAHVVRGVLLGFRSLRDVKNFAIFLVLSALYWGANGIGMWVLARGFGLGLSLDGAFAVMSVVAAAITLPNTPGLVGQFHAAGKFSIMLYLAPAVVEGAGMAYIVTLHAAQALWYVGLGLAAMLITSLPMGRVVRASKEAAEQVSAGGLGG